MGKSVPDFKKICRTCMKVGKKMQSVFGGNKKSAINVTEMLKECASVLVIENDGLPTQICSKCACTLKTLYNFKNQCKQTDLKLKEYLHLACFEDKSKWKNGDQCVDTDSKSENIQSDSEITEKENQFVNPVEICKIEVHEETAHNNAGSKDSNKHKIELKNDLSATKKLPVWNTMQCDVCGKFLSCKTNLAQHLRRHSGEKPFACDVCHKRFGRSEHVAVHKRIHTGEKPHRCSHCGKSFAQHAGLYNHLRIHTGERPHVCATCGKAFAQAVTLTYHMRTHTGETPFVCKICNKGFTHSGNLNIHMRFHRGERPFVCNTCGRRFVTSSHLSVHVKQHVGLKEHVCNVCSKAFVRREHLKDHLFSHSGEKPHACKLCPKRYTQSSHLSRHMKTHKT